MRLIGSVLVAVVVFIFLIASPWFNRSTLETVRSPDGTRTAKLQRLAEGDSVPYGMQLIIYPTDSLLGQWSSTAVFRGYCLGTSSLKWKSDAVLVLSCGEFDGVDVREGQLEGIRVEYFGPDREDPSKANPQAPDVPEPLSVGRPPNQAMKLTGHSSPSSTVVLLGNETRRFQPAGQRAGSLSPSR